MAGPLSGLGAQQQVQLSSLQAGQNNSQQVRPQDESRTAEDNRVQPANAESAQTQRANTDVQDGNISRERVEELRSEGRERGTLVDIEV